MDRLPPLESGPPSRAPLAVALASFLLFLLPGLLGPYGYFIDEYYYFACSERLAFGYVDHPPFSIFVLRAVRSVLGDGLIAFRLPVACVGAATVLVTAGIARRLGAGAFGQGIAAACIAASPILQLLFGFYSMNAFEVFFWAALAWVLVEIELRDAPRLWILFGCIAGLALENKHTFVLFGGALALGIVFTRARRHLRERWLWLGLAVALALLVPNLLWQLGNDWPSLEFYRNADAIKNVPTPPLEAALQQVLFHGPGTFPVWALGLAFLLREKRLRHLGWAGALLLAVIVTGGKSRPDRIAGLYPLLFAAGAVPIEAIARRARGRWIRFALPAWMLVTAAALAPLAIPILPIGAMAEYAARSKIVPQIEAGEGKVGALPQWFADRTGWEKHVRDVADALDTLSPAERERAPVIGPSYGHCGALELHAEELGHAGVYGGQNSYWMWGPPVEPYTAAVVVGSSQARLEEYFEEVTLFRTTEADTALPWRARVPVWIVRRPHASIAKRWDEWKHYE